ncbi:MAG TPA: hypothetical protein VK672_05850, partial [Solirubrobacteraceae bacterium]|nr:hypothetical protein [Solirubrobacteraceae bacterium]
RSDAHTTDRCSAGSHRHLVAVDPQAAVYEAQEPGFERGTLGVFGCAFGHSRSFGLGRVPRCGVVGGGKGCFGVEQIRLAGTMVAYERFDQEYVSEEYVVVRDLKSGRVLHHVPTGVRSGPEANPADVGGGPVRGLVVKPDGSVAWMVEDGERSTLTPSGDPAIRYLSVYAQDRSGLHLLSAGTNIDVTSLALGGSTVYWTEGGHPMSATLN